MRLFLSTLKRFFVIFRKRPIFVSSIISFLLGIILFFIALFRNRLTHSFIFELNLLYPDWAVIEYTKVRNFTQVVKECVSHWDSATMDVDRHSQGGEPNGSQQGYHEFRRPAIPFYGHA